MREYYYLNFEYKQGYFKALQDVKNYFDSHSDVLKKHKMYNAKKLPILLQAFLDNWDKMVYEGDNIEITIKEVQNEHNTVKKQNTVVGE